MQLKSTQNSWSCNKRSVTNSTIQLASKVRTFPTKSTFQVSLKPNTPSSNFYRDYNQTNNIDPENPAHRSNLPWKRKKRQLSIKIPARESKCWRRRKTAKKVRRPISSAQFRNHSRSKNNRGSHCRARSDSTSRFQKRAAEKLRPRLEEEEGGEEGGLEMRLVAHRCMVLGGQGHGDVQLACVLRIKKMPCGFWNIRSGWPGSFYKRTNLAFFIKKYIKFKIL